VVSDHATCDDRQAAAALGAVAFFAKPFNPDGLLKAIVAACPSTI
jgi:DNA-binding NtrC family response regulator